MTEGTTSKKEAERERALREAREMRASIDRVLEENRREMKQIRAVLRRAGLLRD
ncbi:MAG TPA: hypothetical protein VFT79_02410 [Solirubrobacterales bacterium]|nr:hypothetical protein [Solirubrobacterales bacterium]